MMLCAVTRAPPSFTRGEGIRVRRAVCDSDCKTQSSALPVFCEGAGAPVVRGKFAALQPCEGRGAPAGAPCNIRACDARRCPCDRTPRLPALHVRFCKGRTYPPYRPQVRASWDARSASPHFAIPVQQAPCRAVVMPPGRVPKPPGGEGANLTRGRRASRNRRPPR